MITFLKVIPASAALTTSEFLGLSPLGYLCYAILWVAQAAVFRRGMDAIRRFIDWAGPAVYLVMIILCVYLVVRAGGLGSISLNLHGPAQLSVSRDDRGRRLGRPHPVELVQLLRRHPLHPGNPRRSDRPPVRGADRGLPPVSRQKVRVDEMFGMTTTGRYWFRNGYSPNAVAATLIGDSPAIAMVLAAGVLFGDSENMLLSHGGDFSSLVGCGLGFLSSWLLEVPP
jgi:cytosine/uracil/thiamine/allantoin permease